VTIFGRTKLAPLPYVLLLLALFALDFAKDPIERFIMARHDEAARDLMAPRSASPAQPAMTQGRPAPGHRPDRVNGQNMPLMFNNQQAAINELAASGRQPTAEQLDKVKAVTVLDAVSITLGGGPDPQTARLVQKRSTYEALYIAAVIAMTAITVVGLLYALSSRLRDIGWPQAVLWLMLAPVFLPKFLVVPLPMPVVYGVTVFFYGLMLVLALLPSTGADPTESGQAAVEPRPTAVAKRPRAQFGKLGT
jgi:uncharacterized membrane protein YhaH (DUF805 family)